MERRRNRLEAAAIVCSARADLRARGDWASYQETLDALGTPRSAWAIGSTVVTQVQLENFDVLRPPLPEYWLEAEARIRCMVGKE